MWSISQPISRPIGLALQLPTKNSPEVFGVAFSLVKRSRRSEHRWGRRWILCRWSPGMASSTRRMVCLATKPSKMETPQIRSNNYYNVLSPTEVKPLTAWCLSFERRLRPHMWLSQGRKSWNWVFAGQPKKPKQSVHMRTRPPPNYYCYDIPPKTHVHASVVYIIGTCTRALRLASEIHHKKHIHLGVHF